LGQIEIFHLRLTSFKPGLDEEQGILSAQQSWIRLHASLVNI